MKKNETSFEQTIRIPLDTGEIIECGISIASTIVVGPGPRPRRGLDAMLIQWIDENRFMTIETVKEPGATASISVGPGTKPP